MTSAPAPQPQPDKRAAADDHLEQQRAAARRAADDDARVEARKRADERAEAEEQEERLKEQRRRAEARRRIDELRASELEMSRKLVESSNKAAVALEIDAVYGQLSAFDLPIFQEQAKLEREQFLATMLTAAGRGLLDSFTDILNADGLWELRALSENEFARELERTPHPFRCRAELVELLTHHIPEVLVALGYQPPPPSESWTDLVQTSVQRLLTASQDEATFTANSAKARKELIFFTWRLRVLVEAAEREIAGEEQPAESRISIIVHSMRNVVTAARNRAIPTALAAGTSAAVAGALAGPAGMGIAFLSGGAASLLASATEAAATAWLANAGVGDVPVMSPSWAVKADLAALDWCIDLMRSATSATIDSTRFIVRRGIFQILQDAADSAAPMRDFLWEWSKTLLSLLDREIFPLDEAHQMVDLARSAFAKS